MTTGIVIGHDGRRLKIEIPEGFYRVFSGPIKPGDQFLNMQMMRDGVVQWENATIPSRKAVARDRPYSRATWFSMVIRKGAPVQKPCENCEVRGCAVGYRLCSECRLELHSTEDVSL